MSAQKVRAAAAIVVTVAIVMLAPAPALAGWHARLSLGPTPAVSHIYYDAGKVRLERSEGSLIIDLATGAITTFSNDAKAYMQTSIAELAAIQDEMRRQMPAGGRANPPAMATPKPEATGRSVKVGPFACDVYAWKTIRGEGELCLSKDVGIDLGGFPAEIAGFAEKLKPMASASIASAIFELAFGGFPVRSVQKVNLGGRVLEKKLDAIESTIVPAALFLPPEGYIRKDMPRR